MGMMEFILSALADFALIFSDRKHRKRIEKKEKADGKKRQFQKYALQPSAIVFGSVFLLIGIFVFWFFSYQNSSIFPSKTQKELQQINDAAKAWHDKYGTYPSDLKELIGINPMRKSWKRDAWGRPYRYSVVENEKKCIISSAGPDGTFKTEDDIFAK